MCEEERNTHSTYDSFKIYPSVPKTEPEDVGVIKWRKVVESKCVVKIEVEEDITIEEETKPLMCAHEECYFLADTDSQMKTHVRKCHSGLKCVTCLKKFENRKQLNRHKSNHSENRPFTCEENELRSHRKRHENMDRCKRCEYTTEDRSAMNIQNKTYTQQYPYSCTVCNKGFFMKALCQEHMSLHAGDNPFQCNLCGKAFPLGRYLAAHKRLSHSQLDVPQVLKCEICSKSYTNKQTYKNHVRSHTRTIIHLCDICGKGLTTQQHLKYHRRTHTGEKPNVCDVCGKGFAKKCNLNQHRRTHTGEKPHVCDVCQKAYTQRSALVIHKRSHSGQRPYVCTLCSKGFVCKAHLNVHLSRHPAS